MKRARPGSVGWVPFMTEIKTCQLVFFRIQKKNTMPEKKEGCAEGTYSRYPALFGENSFDCAPRSADLPLWSGRRGVADIGRIGREMERFLRALRQKYFLQGIFPSMGQLELFAKYYSTKVGVRRSMLSDCTSPGHMHRKTTKEGRSFRQKPIAYGQDISTHKNKSLRQAR